MVGFSLIFIDDWAIRWFGSYLIPASITWLNYGKVLMRVVVAIFGQAAGVASFPLLARSAAEKKWDELKSGIEDALLHVILAMIPISILMAILSRQIVYLLFSHTRLMIHDMEQTSLALVIFLAGAIAWGIQNIVGRGFYALGDTLTPTLIGSGMALAWLPVYWQLGKHFEFAGLAAASSLGVFAYTAVLCIVLDRRLKMPLGKLASLLIKTLLCGAVAALAGLLLERKLQSLISWQRLAGSLLQATAVSAAFLAVFIGFGAVSGMISWRQLRSAVGMKSAS
jgi:putative peptidoglycan lipid II flippase